MVINSVRTSRSDEDGDMQIASAEESEPIAGGTGVVPVRWVSSLAV